MDDLLEADFWTGITSGLPVIRTRTLEAADRRGSMNVLPHELPSCACIYNADLGGCSMGNTTASKSSACLRSIEMHFANRRNRELHGCRATLTSQAVFLNSRQIASPLIEAGVVVESRLSESNEDKNSQHGSSDSCRIAQVFRL